MAAHLARRLGGGLATNVLDGPLSTISHLLNLLASDKSDPPRQADEIIITGTASRAFRVAPGECSENARRRD